MVFTPFFGDPSGFQPLTGGMALLTHGQDALRSGRPLPTGANFPPAAHSAPERVA